MRQLDADVIVVGAGLAGLTAAHELARAGLAVRVLERDARVGGRIHSERRDGRVFERGAQLLSSRYRRVMPLVRELGLTSALRPVTPMQAIARDGSLHLVSAKNPLLALGSALLSKRGWLEAVLGVARTPALVFPELHDYSAWSGADDRDAEAFACMRFGSEAARYLLEPSLESFYFHGLAGTSRALALVQLAYVSRPGTLYTLDGGLGALPEALARTLSVELESEVREVRLEDDGVTVSTDRASYGARSVVLATTASVARRLYAPRNEAEAAVLKAEYASTLNLGVWFDRPRSDANKDFYGLAIPRSERRLLVGIGKEACKDQGDEFERYTLMTSSDAAAQLSVRSDAEVTRELLADGARFLPELAAVPAHTTVARWAEAVPRSPVGRAKSVADYRRAFRAEQRVVLAGDYLGMPFLDGAAETGAWAARALERAAKTR